MRQIVQLSDHIFKIRPGLWALTECREEVLRRYNLLDATPQVEEQFNHAYYQGLLVEIGNLKHQTTYVPAQDQHSKFLDKDLGDICDHVQIPHFTYDHIIKRAKTIDVIWFNERKMPSHFYEVEHTTDIKNSLTKFYELQDFNAKFFIVAAEHRRSEFRDKLSASIFNPIQSRVAFLSYDKVAQLHSSLSQYTQLNW